MKKEVVLSSSQFSILIILFVMGSSVLFLPAMLTGIAKQDASFSVIIGSISGVLVAYFYAHFGRYFHNKSYIEAIKDTFGSKIAVFFVLFTFSYLIFLCSILIWDIGDFIITQILPGTPIQSIYILFLIVVVYVTRLGIETLARTAEIFLPWVFLLFLILIILLFPELEWTNALPIFENGIKPSLYGAYYMIGFPFLELFTLLMFTPYIKSKDKLSKAFLIGVTIGSVALIILTVYCVLILGPGITTRQEYPIYVLGKKISLGNFLERLEIIVAIMWFISIFFKLTLTFYALCLGISQFLNLKSYKVVTIPSAIFFFVITLILIPDSVYIKEYSKYTNTPYIITVGLIIPALVYITALLKKKFKSP
ncbi:spore germination protein KB [Metabacillus crassostreae]|uniref:GerAB/ArcD/ProY family transporter n=1 Tax=Metabacillus crassostreae TaxID=929098 RepID=UPI00195C66CD|nr:endospore germination permease [Metabacillus crassostreae]MBM7603663.1 spore germination protein KB [Metabacillus crassostreae]